MSFLTSVSKKTWIQGWHFTQQNLPAARARTSLASVLGLGRQESLTPDKRDVCLVGRNEATFGKSIVHQAAAFE